MDKTFKNLFNFLNRVEKLKSTLRHSATSSGRVESTAEHVWRVSLMALLFHPHLRMKVDLLKLLKMIIIHDLPEIELGDVPVFVEQPINLSERETQVMAQFKTLLSNVSGDEILSLWEEFSAKLTPESRVAYALDKLEANLQHLESPAATLTNDDLLQFFKIDQACAIDPFLTQANEWIKQEVKLRAVPKIGLGVFVIRDKKVLLGKRKSKHGAGQWASPGGHLEHGEKLEDCARREVEEETGLQIKNIRQATFTNHVFEGTGKHYVTLWMVSDYAHGIVELREPDKFECWDWFDWDNLPSPLFTEEALVQSGFNPLKI